MFLTSDRLASLSDTMFGVAMTSVVTTLLPSVQAYKEAVIGMLPKLNGELIAIVLSFAISARYWVFQQQRLEMTSAVTSLQTLLHLTFLFLVVLIPISTSLNGLTGSGARLVPVMIYGSHLFMLALVNLLLWVEVHRDVGAHPANRAVLYRGQSASRSPGRGGCGPVLRYTHGLRFPLHRFCCPAISLGRSIGLRSGNDSAR